MRLKELRLKNFRPYYGTIQLQFPDNKPGELFLVHGPNGFGKTSLLNAVQWALYGEGPRRELYDHANYRARKEPKFEMSVALTFSHDEDEYTLVREANATREPIEAPEHLSRSTLKLYRNGTPLPSGATDVAQDRIDIIIPRDASQFFFFDGEQIQKYSSAALTDDTRQAIELVLGLRAVQYARDDAGQLKKEIRAQRNKALQKTEEHSRLIADQERSEKELETVQRAAAEAERRITDLEMKRETYRAELDQLADVQTLASERTHLQGDIKDVSKERSLLAETLKKEARGLYLRVLLPQIVQAYDKCEALYQELRERETETRLQVSIREYLAGLADAASCVCGRALDEAQRVGIRELAGQKAVGEEDEAVDGGTVAEVAARLDQLKKARVTAEAAAQRFDEFMVAKVDLDEKLNGLETTLARIENQLKSIDVESVNSLRELVKKTENEVALLHRERGGYETQLTTAHDEIDTLDKQIRRLAGASSITRALDAQMELLDRTEKAFDAYLLRAAQARRTQVENRANVFFKQITNKANGYEAMRINKDFSFSLQASDGTMPDMGQISAGEKQVVAFSFIMGLNEYSRAAAPLMIDTPMGRLDTTHRRNLAGALAGLTKQVVLFLTDTDLGFGVEEILREGVEREFEIVHDQATLTSGIKVRGSKQ